MDAPASPGLRGEVRHIVTDADTAGAVGVRRRAGARDAPTARVGGGGDGRCRTRGACGRAHERRYACPARAPAAGPDRDAGMRPSEPCPRRRPAPPLPRRRRASRGQSRRCPRRDHARGRGPRPLPCPAGRPGRGLTRTHECRRRRRALSRVIQSVPSRVSGTQPRHSLTAMRTQSAMKTRRTAMSSECSRPAEPTSGRIAIEHRKTAKTVGDSGPC